MNILLNLYNFDELWAEPALKNILFPGMKLAVLPFSFEDSTTKAGWNAQFNPEDGQHYLDIVHPFLHYGIRPEDIRTVCYFKDSTAQAGQIISDSDILFFPGGLPDRAMERLTAMDLTDTIRNFKGIVMGASAGAMIQLDEYHITPDQDYPEFSYEKGLGLVHDFYIEVHYENTMAQNASISRVLAERGKPLYAVENHGGLIVGDNGQVTLLGGVRRFG